MDSHFKRKAHRAMALSSKHAGSYGGKRNRRKMSKWSKAFKKYARRAIRDNPSKRRRLSVGFTNARYTSAVGRQEHHRLAWVHHPSKKNYRLWQKATQIVMHQAAKLMHAVDRTR